MPSIISKDMTTLIFATNNEHKVNEIRNVLNNNIHIITLKEAGINVDIPEPFNTLEENAVAKATTIHQLTQQNCFSEDTGLEVDALNGEPGVKSARYAGDEKSFQKNIDKLLWNLNGKINRSARFKTVICLIWNKEQYLFE
jgi:XTP/dITP diphosphohydrolase